MNAILFSRSWSELQETALRNSYKERALASFEFIMRSAASRTQPRSIFAWNPFGQPEEKLKYEDWLWGHFNFWSRATEFPDPAFLRGPSGVYNKFPFNVTPLHLSNSTKNRRYRTNFVNCML